MANNTSGEFVLIRLRCNLKVVFVCMQSCGFAFVMICLVRSKNCDEKRFCLSI